MFPIIFFSLANLTFYNKYGINPAANTVIFKTCVAFSAIYIVVYLGLTIYKTILSVSHFMKFLHISNYVCDIFTSIIIILSIGSDKTLGLIIIILVN